MWIVPVLIAVVVGLLVLAFVLYPLYRHAQNTDDGEGRAMASIAPTLAIDHTLNNGHIPPATQPDDAINREREEAARAALREIELDYHLGNIEEDDYRTLRERYMRRALVALKARQEGDRALDEAIEARLLAFKEDDMDTNDHV